MGNDPGPSTSSSKIVILMIIAVIVVIGATVMLNGTTTTEEVVNDTNNTTTEDTGITPVNIASTDMGTVEKYSGFGNNSSEIHIAIICGMDSDGSQSNSVLATLESMSNLKYSYDLYVINATDSASTNNTTGNDTNTTNTTSNDTNSSNITVNNKTETLASEYVVPDIESNNYNFSVDIHGVDASDSNSYIFVPVDDTYTSSLIVSSISNSTSVGKYTPDSYNYADSLGIPLINNNIGSIVYISNQYYSNSTSTEISSVLTAIDNFDFLSVLEENSTDNTTDNTTDNSTNNTTSNNTDNSVGNTEI
ncbi:MAG: hypothetical protein LUG89_05770 [Methanosphaera sp.]|nr:hypothetical protein [Methanosphaera sp.]